MSHADLYFQANEQLLLENLISIEEEYFNTLDKSYWNESYQNISFVEWKAVLSQNGYDINRIKRNRNRQSMRQYFYQGEYLTPEINALDPHWLLSPFVITCLRVDEMGKQEFENRRYVMYFFSENNLFAIDYFIRHFDKIEDEDKYEAFKSMYIHCNYGFELFPEEILDKVFALADNSQGVQELEGAAVADDEGYVTIYRGEGARSTPVTKAHSWTLSVEIANRFGHFFEAGTVYQGKVKLEKIIDFISERNEEEIWVRYSDIQDVRILASDDEE